MVGGAPLAFPVLLDTPDARTRPRAPPDRARRSQPPKEGKKKLTKKEKEALKKAELGAPPARRATPCSVAPRAPCG